MAATIFVSVVAGAVCVETALWLFARSRLAASIPELRDSALRFRAAGSDELRQQILLSSGFQLLRSSLTALFMTGVVLALFAAPLIDPDVDAERYLFCASAAGMGWWLLRSVIFPSRPDEHTERALSHRYSSLDRWLHRIALANPIALETSFDMDRAYASSGPESPAPLRSASLGPVYVCGLARSGTTLALRILASSPSLVSLTYRDMPFVLAPNLWRMASNRSRSSMPLVERAHGDGMLVDYDSPEAFEEVFWDTFGSVSVSEGALDCKRPSPELLGRFADYRRLVANPARGPRARTETRRYLSKNNNNLLRLQSLAEPDATILVVYRDPAATARSLLEQHLRFSRSQLADPFTRTYMGWLRHHEFGPDHRPYRFALAHMDRSLEPGSADYWLDYWTAVHTHILDNAGHVALLSYDRLCENPRTAVPALLEAAKVATPATLPIGDIRGESGRRSTASPSFSALLLERARAVHHALLTSERNILHAQAH